MSTLLRTILLLLAGAGAYSLRGAASDGNMPYFKLAGQTFSYAEAVKIAQLSPEITDLPTAVRRNFAAAATIVLCRRSQIELSSERTREVLAGNLLLLSPESRKQLDAQIHAAGLNTEQWLTREAGKLHNQLTEAIRRWYQKNFGQTPHIQTEHIRSWYYRHQNLFRRIKVDPEQLWVFAAASSKFEQAHSALKQGMAPQAVRKKFALAVEPEAVIEELQINYHQKITLDQTYCRINGNTYIFLFHKYALSSFYLPLDEKLSSAISNALSEAVAKARLAETLKHEFSGSQLSFY